MFKFFLMKGLIYRESFIDNPDKLYYYLLDSNEWDERMKSRKTMSYGKAYNYSQIDYLDKEMFPELEEICNKIDKLLGYKPNNCLINLYKDGRSKMGYHSDQIDILKERTGISILSLGVERNLRFRNIKTPEIIKNYMMEKGSLLYMDQEIQKEWQHSIPKMNTEKSRISLTFRQLR